MKGNGTGSLSRGEKISPQNAFFAIIIYNVTLIGEVCFKVAGTVVKTYVKVCTFTSSVKSGLFTYFVGENKSF